jgi:ubiquinone/menaquinone biosynthesis C-methylase UbiE
MNKLWQPLIPPIFSNQRDDWLRLKIVGNQIIQQLAPPILLDALEFIVGFSRGKNCSDSDASQQPLEQDLEVYWNPKMAEALESWGEGTTWAELEFLMASCTGKVLDIACGTGKTVQLVSQYPHLEVYGCDISDFLISKAIARGIKPDYLTVCDATQTAYEDNFFDYAYSIGSLEHFTEEGILKFVQEAYRITKYATFHMVPVSRKRRDEGWIHKFQSYYNNSTEWWIKLFQSCYDVVLVIDSSWQDRLSVGQWFVCIKQSRL